MSLDQAALISEIVGGIAVVASLIYLDIELRRQNKLNRLSSASDLAAQWSGLMISLHDNPEMAEIWLKGTNDFESLDPTSKLRFGAYFGRFLRNSEALYIHVLDKTLDPTLWRGIERTIRDLIGLPGSQAWWETRKHWYTDAFQSLVSDLIAGGDGKPLFDKYDVEDLQEPNA